jgi:hypothetical protein
MKRLALSLVLTGLAALAAPASAQTADLKARVDALDKQVAALAQAAAQAGTSGGAVQELGNKVGALEQAVAALDRKQASHGALVQRTDELERHVVAAEKTANLLASRLGDVEQPVVGRSGDADGGGDGRRGLALASGDGRYTIVLGGLFQPRLEAQLSDQFDSFELATFRLRRSRLSLDGQLGRDDLTYQVQVELRDPATAMLDAYVDYGVTPWLAIRVGQAKVPFTRQWITSSARLAFLERPAGLDNLRYDRDLGAWLRGDLGGRIGYVLGVSNGAGRNVSNDNIDMAAVVRVDAALIGERFDGYGDLERGDLAVMVGAGALHDLVRMPSKVAGLEAGQRDVDGDKINDNVRVGSASVDAALRYRGFELSVEGVYRREWWGTILDHSANVPVAEAVKPNRAGRRNYLAGYAEASLLVLPRWLIAARVSHTRLALLGVGGATIAAVPPGDRLFELDLSSHLIDDGYRTLGFNYSFQNFNLKDGAEPAADKRHRFILEYQWRL